MITHTFTVHQNAAIFEDRCNNPDRMLFYLEGSILTKIPGSCATAGLTIVHREPKSLKEDIEMYRVQRHCVLVTLMAGG